MARRNHEHRLCGCLLPLNCQWRRFSSTERRTSVSDGAIYTVLHHAEQSTQPPNCTHAHTHSCTKRIITTANKFKPNSSFPLPTNWMLSLGSTFLTLTLETNIKPGFELAIFPVTGWRLYCCVPRERPPCFKRWCFRDVPVSPVLTWYHSVTSQARCFHTITSGM